MYKLLNENQNKNNLKEEYEKLVTNYMSSKSNSKEETILILYEEFIKDMINYIVFNITKMDELVNNKNNKKTNIDINSYLKAFIDKLLNILEMNSIINNDEDFIKLFYASISQLLLDEENNKMKLIYILFFKIFLSYLKDNKDNYNYFKDKINKLSIFIKNLILNADANENETNDESSNKEAINSSVNLYKKIYYSFLDEFLPNFFESFMNNMNNDNNSDNLCLFDILNNFLFYYENIMHEISIKYFASYDVLNWRKKYLETLDSLLFDNIKKKNINFNDKDIDKINEIIISKNFIILNKILSLLFYNDELFNNYFNILMKSIEKYLMNEIEKENDFYNKIEIIYNIEKELLNINNINFFFIDKKIDIKTIYHKLIFDIFCKDKNNSVNEILVKAFDSIIRKTDNENEIKIKSNILFKYIDIVPDYENFESLYIHSIINRSIEDVYDYIKEKQFIDDIIAFSSQISQYSYRLQTLINNIKRKNINNISLTIIPSHCYYLYNLNCKPNICPKLLSKFKNTIINDLKLSENINPIFQQGSIIFNINTPKLVNFKNISIKSDILQYSILKYIGIENSKKYDDIKNEINLSDDLGRFILNEMMQYNLVLYNESEDTYCLNKSFKVEKNKNEIDVSTSVIYKDGEGDIDIRINYKFFFEGKLNFNINKYHKKLGIKHQRMIIQCYIVKFLKMNKDKKNNDFNTILDYLQNSLPLIAKMNLDKEELNANIDILLEKGFITSIKINNATFYHYA